MYRYHQAVFDFVYSLICYYRQGGLEDTGGEGSAAIFAGLD